jgi:hypothetical protein
MSHHPFPWRDLFLACLREMPVVQRACDTVGIERCTAYRARLADKDFAGAWDDAMEAGVDRAEQEAFRRAVVGFEEPVVYQGALSTVVVRDEHGAVVLGPDGEPLYQPLTIRKHSDALLSLILKGRRKKVYAERTEITGAEGGPVAMDDTTRAARAAQLLEVARQRKAADDFSEFA